MIRSVTLFFIFMGLVFAVSAQREANNWYFGHYAGVTFNTVPPTALTDGNLFTNEGCASISSPSGQLLFYTDGTSVWDNTHNKMPNGTGLKGNSSSTQSAIIVPRPDSSYHYYIFTVDELSGKNGLQYSEVNMKLNSGKGDIISSKKNIKLKGNVCEKLAAVKKANGYDYWVLVLKYNSDSLFAFSVTSTGVNLQPVGCKTGLTITGGIDNTVGCLKISTDGKKIAYANNGLGISAVGDFNTSNGKISNLWKFNAPFGYGIEFSKNNKFLYTTQQRTSSIFQYDLSSADEAAFAASQQVIDNNGSPYALQIGPDDKIYISKVNSGYLDVIHAPDSPGVKCRVERNYIDLHTTAALGLPNLVSSFFRSKTFSVIRNCLNDSTFFTILESSGLDSVNWFFDDPASGKDNNSKQVNGVYHIYRKEGYYNAKLIYYYSGLSDTSELKFYIYKPDKPNLGKDHVFCNSFNIILHPQKPYKNYLWINNKSTGQFNKISQNGTYILWVTDNNNCISGDTVAIKTGPKFKVFIGNDTAFCGQFSHLLKASPGFVKYNWNTGSTAMQITVTSKGIYSVKVIDSNTCPSGDTVAIDQIPKPVIKLSYDSLTCKYVYLLIDTLKGLNYLWSTGEITKTIKVEKKGWYAVTASHPFCSNRDSVFVNTLAMPEVNLGVDTSLCANEITLKTNEQGNYLWSTMEKSPSIVINVPGKYWLTVTKNNCAASDTIDVKLCEDMLYYIPNAFTPNDDNTNDVFRVYGSNIAYIEMEIYNRWGEKLFEANGKDPFWNGTYKNEMCMEAVYLYKVKIKGKKAGSIRYLKGSLTLLK